MNGREQGGHGEKSKKDEEHEGGGREKGVTDGREDSKERHAWRGRR